MAACHALHDLLAAVWVPRVSRGLAGTHRKAVVEQRGMGQYGTPVILLLPLCTSRSRSHGLSRHHWRFLCKCYHYQHREQPAASSPPLTGGGKTGSTHSQLQLGLPTMCPPAGRKAALPR
jgi:hypothetical protein